MSHHMVTHNGDSQATLNGDSQTTVMAHIPETFMLLLEPGMLHIAWEVASSLLATGAGLRTVRIKWSSGRLLGAKQAL